LRLAASSKALTYTDRADKKTRSVAGGARNGDGCAAMSQEGHGVGTDPICFELSADGD
jgi:hypothetical protein